MAIISYDCPISRANSCSKIGLLAILSSPTNPSCDSTHQFCGCLISASDELAEKTILTFISQVVLLLNTDTQVTKNILHVQAWHGLRPRYLLYTIHSPAIQSDSTSGALPDSVLQVSGDSVHQRQRGSPLAVTRRRSGCSDFSGVALQRAQIQLVHRRWRVRSHVFV